MRALIGRLQLTALGCASRAHLGYTATEVRAQVIRKLHHRCWVAGTPAAASHHPSETGANDVVIEHLLQASWQIAAGELEPHAMPVEDIWQESRSVLDVALRWVPAGSSQQMAVLGIGQARRQPVKRLMIKGGMAHWNCALRAWRW